MSVLQREDPTLVGGFAIASPAAAAPAAVETEAWVDRRHPQYDTYEAHWAFLRQAYVGGPEYLAANLFSFFREGQQEFKDRLQRAHHYDFARKVVELMNGYLWEQRPTRKRDDLSAALQEFWADADRAGHDIDDVMMQQASPWAMAFGRYFAVVDKPAEAAETRAEERERRLFPYVTFYSPLDVLDARIEDGTPAWVLLRERVRDDADPEKSSGAVREQYRLWTRTDWSLWEKRAVADAEGNTTIKAVEVDRGVHALGEVPIVAIDHRAPESWFVSPSLIWEVAYLDRSIYNHISLLDAILYDVSFPQLAIPYQALLQGAGQRETGAANEARGALIVISTSRAFTYDGSAPTAPAWIAPPSDPASVLMARIDKEIDELYRHVSLAGEMAQAVSEASGISKEHEFRKLNKLLATQADNLQSAEMAILRLAAKWMGEDPDEIPEDAVDYPDDFDVKTLLDDLAEIRAMQEAELPAEVLAEAKREAVARRFAKLPAEEMKALIEAIEAAATAPEFDVDAAIAEMRRRDMEERMRAGAGGGGGGEA